MRLRRLLLATLFAAAACGRASPSPPHGSSPDRVGQSTPEADQWLLGPEPGADLLRADASEESLKARFGAAAVRSDSVYVGEGLSLFGTILFPDDSARRLSVVWTDTTARARPAYVYVSGRKSRWRLYPGVGIGTDLRTVEQSNGRDFQLSGFGWDYSGTTVSFNRGRLDSLWRRGGDLGDVVLLRFDPDGPAAPDSITGRVSGDRTFSSADPAMQSLNPRIYQILVRPR